MNATKWFRSHFSNDSSKQQDQNVTTQPPSYEQSQLPQTNNQSQSQPSTQNPTRTTIIEVFQSQGCNSCPPTNTLLLSKMAQADPNTLILDYHVIYWDRLGWKDPFGVPAADAYQRDYAHARGTSRVYTPQVVVNGVAEGVGNTKHSLDGLIEEGQRRAAAAGPWLTFAETSGGVLISEAKTTAAAGAAASSMSTERRHRQGRVVEVVYDPVAHEVYIPRGENARRTLVQRNTVRSVRDLGVWTDGQGPLPLEPRDASDGLQRVLVVQEGRGGPIIGVGRISF